MANDQNVNVRNTHYNSDAGKNQSRRVGSAALGSVWREWMGVEPTAARSARPATGFEDRGSHRAPTTPTNVMRKT